MRSSRAARHDIACVMHPRSVNGVAVSAQAEGLVPLSPQALLVLSSLGYHDYEVVAVNPDEKPRLVRDLRDRFEAHPHRERTAKCIALYDNPAFDPAKPFEPIETFEPMLRRLIPAPKRSIYMTEVSAA